MKYIALVLLLNRVRDCSEKPAGTLLGVTRTCNEKPDRLFGGNARQKIGRHKILKIRQVATINL